MKIERNGVITLPPEILERYGLAEGDEVEIVPLLNAIMLRKARLARGDFARMRGALRGRALTATTDEYLDEVRGR